jgi:branched-subunit amino acid ABC-type transport system permease component
VRDALLHSWTSSPGTWIVSAVLAIAVYVAIAIAVPIAVARLPEDVLVRPLRRRSALERAALTVVGLSLVGAGVALLFLPGPGVLTMLLGLSIVGGEWSARAVRWLASRPKVFATINAVREKRGRPPLVHPG